MIHLPLKTFRLAELTDADIDRMSDAIRIADVVTGRIAATGRELSLYHAGERGNLTVGCVLEVLTEDHFADGVARLCDLVAALKGRCDYLR